MNPFQGTHDFRQDDRESLAELHRFLHGDVVESPTDDQPLLASHRLSTSTYSHKSDRRRSLPTRTSMASISNDMIPPHRPEASDFQIRRRRAAKLTSFFGVDYRELIQDILESIEKGVEEERKRGTLRPEEVEVSSIAFSVWNCLLTSRRVPHPSLCCINFMTFGRDGMDSYNISTLNYLAHLTSFTFVAMSSLSVHEFK